MSRAARLRRRPSARLRVVLGVVLGSTLAACSSPTFAGRVTIRDFAAEQPTLLTLASESHMTEVMGVDPVEWFSAERESVELKMQDDAAMRALVRDLEGLGFGRWASDGRGAAGPESGFTSVVEVEVDGETRHVSTTEESDQDLIAASARMKWAFIDLYNRTLALQSVTSEVGQELFEETSLKSTQK